MACPHARCKSGVARRAAGRRPYRLRYLLAWDHALARAVLGVYVRVLLGFQSHRARRRGILDGRSGCVTVIQCFGGGLNLNLHFHTLLFEGVFFAGTRTARLISGPCRLRRTRRSASCWRGSLRGCSVCSNAAGSKPAMPTCCRPIRWWNTRPPWPASAAPRSRGASRSVLARVAACGAWGPIPTRPGCSRPRRGTRTSWGSICTPTSRCRQRIARAWCRYLLRPAVAQDRLRLLDDGRCNPSVTCGCKRFATSSTRGLRALAAPQFFALKRPSAEAVPRA